MKKLTVNSETLRRLTEGEAARVEGAALVKGTYWCTKAIVSCVFACPTQIPQNCY
jgi:hypothetical protein